MPPSFIPDNLKTIRCEIDPHLSEPLAARVVRGSLWVFALRIFNRGLAFIRTVILARLLAPNDFGLFGIAMLSLSAVETFSETGFQAALIQKEDHLEPYLDTAWTVSVLRGAILFVILFFSAPAVAKFFDSPQASLLTRVIAITTLITGFRNVGVVFFQKELQFAKQFYYEFSSTVLDFMVAISLAFILRNAWALIWGGLAANVTRLLMSYLLHSYRPKFRFRREEFFRLFHFGKWVFGSSILMFLISQGDDIFVGKILGVTALGLYQMAYLISNLPATEITHVVSRVTFPAYSKLQHDVNRLREAYVSVLHLTAFCSIPATAAIIVLAPDFIHIFLGEKWILAVPALQVLALWGMIRSLGATTGPVFHSTGNPKVLTQLQFVVVVILALIIYPLTKTWGILGTSWAVVISTLMPNFAAFYMVTRIIELRGIEIIKGLFIASIQSLIMIIFTIIFRYYCISSINILSFSLSVFLIVFIYFVLTIIFRRSFTFYRQSLDIIMERLCVNQSNSS